MKLESLVQYLDGYLGSVGHPDYPTALNGLQVQGADSVRTVCTAVDGSFATVEAAAELDADLLIVHHGIFWGGLRPVTGRRHGMLRRLFDADLSVYSSHLPLDAHAEVGNCALLAAALGLSPEGRVGAFQGAPIGWWGRTPEPWTPDQLRTRVAEAVGGPVRMLVGGPEIIDRVGIVTGGGASFLEDASALDLDAFVTGEATHHTFIDAAEIGIHVALAGHYATETFGVRALGEHLSERFDLHHHFIDLPTGL